MDLDLGGKVVLITGGTDGLGLALAHRLAGEGAAVAICGRNEERLAKAEQSLEAVGGDVLAVRADAERASDIESFVAGAVSRWGKIDGIVHNAGRSAAGPLQASDDEVWESDLRLKVMGAVRLARAALPLLRVSKGAALFTLGIAAKSPGAASEPSSVSRAAGMALMKSLSKELGPEGIRVNAILIGLIESGQWVRTAAAAGTEPAAFYEQLAADAAIPLGRVGRAEEFADLACFLLSSRASYLTGTAINLDGGLASAV